MSEFHFSFKGVDSDALCAYAMVRPTYQQPVLNGEKLTIPGRHGMLFQGDGSYAPVEVKIDVGLRAVAARSDAMAWLSGAGRLIFSDEPTLYYDAMVLTGFNRAPISNRGDSQKMTVTFTCQPFRHEVSEAQIVLTRDMMSGDYWSFAGHGHIASDPILKIEGNTYSSGAYTYTALIVNGVTIHVLLRTGVPLYIDCEAGTAYIIQNDEKVFAGNDIELTDGAWFALKAVPETETDLNIVTPSSMISKVTITPRWRYF